MIHPASKIVVWTKKALPTLFTVMLVAAAVWTLRMILNESRDYDVTMDRLLRLNRWLEEATHTLEDLQSGMAEGRFDTLTTELVPSPSGR